MRKIQSTILRPARSTGEGAPVVRRRRPMAFTLLEVIVVVVILGVLAAVIAPRVLNVGQRQAELEAKSVQRLLSVCAEKCDVWNRPVAIDYVQETSRLCAYTEVQDAKATDDTTGAARITWKEDGLIEPVALDRLHVTMALQDGVPLPNPKWRVTFIPGQPRPVLAIDMAPKLERDGPRYTVTINPGETVATRSTGGTGFISSRTTTTASGGQRSIDLDDSGKGQSKW